MWRYFKTINKECTALKARLDRLRHGHIYICTATYHKNSLKRLTVLFRRCSDVLCTVVFVGLSTLEQLEERLHLMGIFLEAAEQGVVSQNGLQHLWLPVVLEYAWFAVGGGQCALIQHLDTFGKHEGNIRKDIKIKALYSLFNVLKGWFVSVLTSWSQPFN